jgi:diguanylate cyclase (GGDEF)-like protein/PAS domain S-box-containing protein
VGLLTPGVFATLAGILLGAMAAVALLPFLLRRSVAAEFFYKCPTPVWIWDRATLRFLDVNAAAIEQYGYSRREFLSMTVAQIRPPEDLPKFQRALEGLEPEGNVGVWRHRTKSGKTIFAAIRGYDLRFRGRPARLSTLVDVTAQIEGEQRLRESEATMQLAQEVAHLGSFDCDYRTGRGSCSEELCRMMGIDPKDAAELSLWTYDHPEDAGAVREEVQRAREERRQYKSDHRLIRPDGNVRYVEERGYWTYDERGEPIRIFGTVLDITERKTAETALAHLAYHDPLTNLLNRTGVRDHLTKVTKDRRAAGLTPVFFLDLDRFKSVNDTLGHVAGDQLIVEISRRLQRHLQADEILARTGGDEFVIVSPPASDRTAISMRARELMDVFSAPFTIGGIEHGISVSMGISVYPHDALTTDALLRNADVAMYAAKARGGGTFHYYTVELQRHAEERFRMEAAMRRALEHGEFQLHYQPVVSSRGGRIVSVEALLRWNDPELGPVMPVEFIPLAEETGFVKRIGAWVFEAAFAQAKAWSDAGMPLRVWVNVSAAQLHDAALPHRLADLLAQYRLDGSLIGLELTESSFIDHQRDLIATLNQIRALGIQLALDDFGVKYSSLDYLQRLPINTVKIDRIFIDDIAANRFNASIVRAVVGVAHDMGFHVTAEGIESPEQLEIISRLQCDAWQGFLFSAPRPPEEIEELIADATPDYAAT